MHRRFHQPVAVFALLAALPTAPIHAQTCPFDNGGSSLEVEGLILTRYALGLSGAPLVASTGINAVDAPTVEASINCTSCGLNITGNLTMTVADATIISRKLAGFSGAALTDNLSLGSGTRNTPAAVQSFLLAGCGATGGTVTSITAGTGVTGGVITASGTIAADTTYLQRRVSTGCAVGSFITAIAADGTPTCATPSSGAGGTVTRITAGSGLTGGTITGSGTIAVNTAVIQSRVTASCAAGSSIRAIAADGTVTCQTETTGGSGTVTSITTGSGLTGGPISTTGTIGLTANQLLPSTACAANQIAKWSGTAWACAADDAGPANAFVQGGNAFGAPGVLGTTDAQPLTVKSGGTDIRLVNQRGDGLRVSLAATSPNTINGNANNTVTAGRGGQTIGGGGDDVEYNKVTDDDGTVSGGFANTAGYSAVVAGGGRNSATGNYSTVAGGISNKASGEYSFAAGSVAEADLPGTFVWADSSLGFPFKATLNWVQPTYGKRTFNVRATGGVMFATSVNFPSGTPATYCYMGNSGAGWICSSDRNVKERIEPITPSRVLAGVLAMPVSTWSIIGSKVRQMGPMAQDFYRAFGLGDTDKAINSIDVGGVAFAAIQGLNQVVQKKDAEIAALKKRLVAIEKRLGIQ